MAGETLGATKTVYSAIEMTDYLYEKSRLIRGRPPLTVFSQGRPPLPPCNHFQTREQSDDGNSRVG